MIQSCPFAVQDVASWGMQRGIRYRCSVMRPPDRRLVAVPSRTNEVAKPEDVSFRREAPLISTENVLEVTSKHLGVKPSHLCERRRNSILRPIVARMLVKYAGLTIRQVADRLGMKSGSAAGKQARRMMALKEGLHCRLAGRKVEKLIAEIEEVLDRQTSQMGPQVIQRDAVKY